MTVVERSLEMTAMQRLNQGSGSCADYNEDYSELTCMCRVTENLSVMGVSFFPSRKRNFT